MLAFQRVHELGLPSPAVHPSDASDDGIVRFENRLGIVMDRIDGPSMLEKLSHHPWWTVRYARILATLHAEMHSRSASSLPSQRQRFHAVINRLAEELGDDATSQIRRVLDALPDAYTLCHGDFHPDNVILSSLGPVIIDWGPATSGNAAADLAWTEYLFRHAGNPPSVARRQRAVIFLFRRAFCLMYRPAYTRIASVEWEEVRAWAPVVAAIRLGDHIAEEKEFLLSYLHDCFPT
jgi:aminoglycoside phosphotransferase (APT) family kinase protein